MKLGHSKIKKLKIFRRMLNAKNDCAIRFDNINPMKSKETFLKSANSNEYFQMEMEFPKDLMVIHSIEAMKYRGVLGI
jgi:hypothetical protein